MQENNLKYQAQVSSCGYGYLEEKDYYSLILH